MGPETHNDNYDIAMEIPFRGGSRIYKRGGGLTQGTNLLGRDVLELGGSGGMPPQENLEK